FVTEPIQKYAGDTLLVFSSTGGTGRISKLSRTVKPYIDYNNNLYYAFTGYTYTSFPDFKNIYSARKEDSLSFYPMGSDSSGNGFIALLKLGNQNSIQWKTTIPNSFVFNADTSNSFVYAAYSGSDQRLGIKKLSKNTGEIQWNQEMTADPHQSIIATDLGYSSIRHRFFVSGYITDSTDNGVNKSYYYLMLDTSGNVVQKVIERGSMLGETKINKISFLQDSLTIAGGSIATNNFGLVGFYMGLDSITLLNIVTGVPVIVRNEFSMEVYPNPSNGQLNLSFQPVRFNKYIYVQVYNASGVLVSSWRIENVTAQKHIYHFNLSANSGIYFIRVLDDRGNQRNTLVSLINGF
ncbi:MAG TPA: T9SS type A sorting domain-containing protein, partial [Flavisolibacter sp.]|nr:T9SS type A sorting domain-containing protein [Flavisolibacter sp.]